MQTVKIILILICGWNLCFAQQLRPQPCDTIKAVLDDMSAIKPGASRADLEKSFSIGSFTFRGAATYVSKRCQYLAIDVEFDPDPSSPTAPSPADKIKKTSRVYLAYPSMD